MGSARASSGSLTEPLELMLMRHSRHRERSGLLLVVVQAIVPRIFRRPHPAARPEFALDLGRPLVRRSEDQPGQRPQPDLGLDAPQPRRQIATHADATSRSLLGTPVTITVSSLPTTRPSSSLRSLTTIMRRSGNDLASSLLSRFSSVMSHFLGLKAGRRQTGAGIQPTRSPAWAVAIQFAPGHSLANTVRDACDAYRAVIGWRLESREPSVQAHCPRSSSALMRCSKSRRSKACPTHSTSLARSAPSSVVI